MAKTVRIYDLAKELGVSTQDIIERCAQDDIEVIAVGAVKLGLAATIREWFKDRPASATEEASSETAEDSAKPASKKASTKKAATKKTATKKAATKKTATKKTATKKAATKKTATKKAATKKSTAKEEIVDKTEVPVEDTAVSEVVAPEETVTKPVESVVEEHKPTMEEAAEERARQVSQSARRKPADEASVEKTTEEPPVEAKSGVVAAGAINVPDRPDVIKPAGEKLAPKKVKLSGPRVVRIEDPEPVSAPRPRRAPRPQSGESASSRNENDITRTNGPVRGGGVRGRGSSSNDERDGGGRRQRNSLSSRRSRGDALPTGPTKFSKADLDELDARMRGASGFVKQRRRDMARGRGGPAATPVEVGGKVTIEEPITIKALSSATGIKAADCVKFLFKQGVMATVNSAIDTEAAMEIAMEYDIELEVKEHVTAELMVEKEFANRDRQDERKRPPVVTIMGHVDHGKTSLLDRIRKADVANHEAGGITQHIGAYRVTVDGHDGENKTVVFLDTPGHAAFTTMRARGAQVTDIVVLLVAADDGVMPQTKESINHAAAAGVPVVVALNKCDLPGFNEDKLQKIYGQLTECGINPTAWGGDTEVIQCSAHTGDGVTELLEILDLQAEVLELTADYEGPGQGIVVEGELQAGRGSVARVLVQEGNLRLGDFFVAGRSFGRVRDMSDDHGKKVREVGPATPVEVSGIDYVPDAGDKFYVVSSLKKAEEYASKVREDERNTELARETRVTLDNFAATIKAGQQQVLNVVVKADVQGSVETLRKSLEEIGNDEVRVRVLHAGVGGVTENDVLLADASDAVIVGFHVTATPAVREIAETRGVDLRMYRIIYELLDEIKGSLEGLLTPDSVEEEVGRAEVKKVFKIGKVGNIAGCMVTSGVAQKSAKVRLERDGAVVTENRNVEALRRVKDEAKEVKSGTECGVRIVGYEDIKPEDIIVFYKVKEIARKLED